MQTKEEVQGQADYLNNEERKVEGVTAVVAESISTKTFLPVYQLIQVTDDTVAAYSAADISTKSLYAQAYLYAIRQDDDFETTFDSKLTELLG